MTRLAFVFLTFLAAHPAIAQLRDLTLADIYDPEKRIRFSGAPQSGLAWIDDRRFFWPKKDAKGNVTAYVAVDTVRGTETPLFDLDDLVARLQKETGLERDAVLKIVRNALPMNSTFTAALITARDDLFVYRFATRSLTRLTSTAAREEEARFSPDGARVAFLRDNDIYVADLDPVGERRLTTGGSDTLLNGKLDYVYQEEVFVRGDYRAFWWSRDSKRIAYLQLQIDDVPMATFVDTTPIQPELRQFRYSKAGDPNAFARLFVVDVATAAGRRIGSDRAETLIVDVTWAPDGAVLYQVQDREQRWIELFEADPQSGTAKRLFREESPAWIEGQLNPKFTRDGSILWISELSGWSHVHELPRTGGAPRQITRGSWEVRDIVADDPGGPWIYFKSNAASPVALDLYRIRLDGSGLQRLSNGGTVHEALFNPSRTMYLERWSRVDTPQRVVLRRADGSLIRIVHKNEVPELAQFRLSPPRFLQLPARDGFAMEAMMIVPPSFDPARKYPVYQYVYSGPRAQIVQDEWPRDEGMFWQLLAQRGIIVFLVDNRSASGKGSAAAFSVYRKAGAGELRDLEDAAAWLERQSFVDPERLLLYGWSYGGFIASYAMTHSETWRAAIAGAPVTDWRTYDSVYTERIMGTPKNNPEGYAASSVVEAAARLSGPLLLIHGDNDDNVHPQNTTRLANALQMRGKPFEMMIYPRARHTIRDDSQKAHIRATMLAFIEAQLLQ
ncbi:MAG: S9 family peptidase [Thermoanaerobaculia bacterium]